MGISKDDYPEEGEVVICTVTKIMPYGAFVTLDEYGEKEGMIHISEISSSWVKNIRDFVREGQKVVAKVIRILPQKGHIDLSLRRVTKQQKVAKIQEWKKRKRVERIIELLSSKLNEPKEVLMEEVYDKLERKYGNVYSSFEMTKERGIEVLRDAGVKKKYALPLKELIDLYIKLPKVDIHGIFEVKVLKPNGVEIIRDGLSKVYEVDMDKVTIKAYTIGAPRYRVEVNAPNYKVAEGVMKEIIDKVTEYITKMGGEVKFYREK
ncbi:MAG: translation initiation factor IF-2 subunit alpha [Candidatus Odinarchaeota archaeon]|nr:translation initiation factor IF-2 subunit alpha [Candidatus Odinarchaeota archaeon]